MDSVKLPFWPTLYADMKTTSTWGVLSMSVRHAGCCAVFLFRCQHALIQGGKLARGLSKVLKRLNLMLNGFDIKSRAEIGPGFWVWHPVGVVIGRIQAGRNLTLFQNVTLGERYDHIAHFGAESAQASQVMADAPERLPTLGDNIIIYAGAVIAGPLQIGDGVRIGANAVVLHDVPAHHQALGVPARATPLKQKLELA